MAQQLIAVTGNEEFPYLLQPDDISEAMGLPPGVALGGYSSAGGINTSGMANSSGDVELGDSAWNNVVQLSPNVTNIYLPTTSPTNAVIHFYPTSGTGSWTLNVGTSSQHIYFTAAGIFNTSSIEVPYVDSLTILSVGNGTMEVIGGTYVFTNGTNGTISNNITFTNTGRMSITPSSQRRTGGLWPNYLENGAWLYGINAGWEYTGSINLSLGWNSYLNLGITSSVGSEEAFTITSYPLAISYIPVNGPYSFSGIFTNLGANSSGVSDTNSTHDILIYLNYYDSSGNLLGSNLILTVPPGTYFEFMQGITITSSAEANAASMRLVITGLTYYEYNAILFSQLKVESAGNSPTFYSDEVSTMQFAKNSFNGSGYQKLPSGMIMQWGRATNTSQSGATPGTANFPLAFPNNVFQVVMTDTSDNAYRYWTSNYTNTSFSFGALETDASTTDVYVTSGDATASYIAYGW